jgi:hypothetical protein
MGNSDGSKFSMGKSLNEMGNFPISTLPPWLRHWDQLTYANEVYHGFRSTITALNGRKMASTQNAMAVSDCVTWSELMSWVSKEKNVKFSLSLNSVRVNYSK